jgi:hypothetical protein
MRTRLQEQRIGDDGAGGREGKQACHRILRAVQQHAQQQAARDRYFGDCRGGAAAARHLII